MKRRNIYLVIFCGLCSIVSCSIKPVVATLEGAAPASVTVIFKDAPLQSFTDRLGHRNIIPESTIQYVDSTGLRVYYIPRSIGYDTISLPAYCGYAELSHRNQAIEEIYYLFKAGDTVLFIYDKNLRPLLRSLTDKENTALYNLPFADARAVQPIGWSTHARLNDYHGQRMSNFDSLSAVYTNYVAEFSALLDAMEANHSLQQVYVDYYRRQLLNQATRKSGFYERTTEHLPYMTDSLMHYISYYRQAMSYRGKLPMEKRFDAIVSDTLLQPLARKAILHFFVEQIVSDSYGLLAYMPEFKLACLEKYVLLTGDTTFYRQAVSAQNIIEGGYSNDLMLKSPDGRQHKYNDILAEHTGKVIYVDLWASWCGPCRAGMPEAKLLREAYKGKDVVFLYLAVSDRENAWSNAIKTLELDHLDENYIVLNTRNSQFFKEIKHERIPHFLLYNRLGKLVDLDAPRPHSKAIREQLDKLLK